MVMKPKVEEVVQIALELDENERAEVAARLLDSLELAEADAEDIWEATIERRAAELESGAVEGVPWEELQQRLLSGRRVARSRVIFHPEAAQEIEEARVSGGEPCGRRGLPG